MFSKAILPRRISSNSCRATGRATRLVVQAKVDLQGGPRVIRGKCFVTRDVSTPHLMLKNQLPNFKLKTYLFTQRIC